MAQISDLSPQLFPPYAIGPGAYLIAPEGLLLNELIVGSGPAQMDILDPPEGHVAIGAAGDVVRVRAAAYVQSAQQGDSAVTVVHELAAVGAIPRTVLADVWLKVTAVSDQDTHFRYTVQRISPSSADQVRFPVDTLVINYGPVDNRLVQLRATRERTPQVEVFTPGDAPWQGTSAQVRLGRLDDLGAVEGEQYGLAAGANLNAAGSAHVRLSERGAHLSQLGLSLDDGSKTTVQLDSSGALKLGADVTAADSVDLGYDPATQTVQIRKLQAGEAAVDGGLAVQGALNGDGDARFGAQADGGALFDLKRGEGALAIAAVTTFQDGVILQDALTIQGDATVDGGLAVKGALSGDGDARFGTQADGGALFDLKSDAGALAIAAVTTFQGDATVEGALAVKGALNGDGDVRFGTQADGGALFDLKSGEGALAIAAVTTFQGGVVLQDALTIQGDATVDGSLGVKGALNGDGNVRLGTQAEGGALFDLKSDDGALAITAVTTFQSGVILQDALTVQGDANFQGAAAFAGDATMAGSTLLQGPTTVHKPITLLEDGALVVGETESVRVDDKGITMRLQPGEHNAVQVLGIGRAALLNAYQTAQSVQQFDMLGYYSAGVPSLHGRVMIGVANVAGGEPDLLLRMTRYFTGVRRMDIRASLLDVKSDTIQLTGDVSVNGNFEFSGTGSSDRIFRLRNLPVRPDGLPTGAVWNDRGTLKIVL